MTDLSLSLYQIDQGLADLLEYREERMADTAAPPDAEELAAVDGEIAKYMQALPAKVAGVAAMLRRWRSTRETAKAEVDRLRGIIGLLEGREARLKALVQDVLEMQPAPKKGCKKLTGVDGSVLMLKGNGGLEPLTITDPAMVPDEYCRWTLRMTDEEWRQTLCYLEIHGWKPENHPDIEIVREPSTTLIREALADGGVPGAHLEPRSSHVEVR